MSVPFIYSFFVFLACTMLNTIWMRLIHLQHIIANLKLIKFLLPFLQRALILFFLLNGVTGSHFIGSITPRMLHQLDSTRFPAIPNCTTVGSPIISTVLKTVCPRYHFAGSMVRDIEESNYPEYLL